jgi:hypothetical protein
VAKAQDLIFRTGTKAGHTQRFVYEAVIMETVRESWTDDRLDDLNQRVAGLSHRMDSRFDRVDTRFDAIDAKFDARFGSMDAKFDAMQRLMIQVGGGIIATLLASFAGLIATQL